MKDSKQICSALGFEKRFLAKLPFFNHWLYRCTKRLQVRQPMHHYFF